MNVIDKDIGVKDSIVLDTSIIIEGLISKKIEKKQIKPKKVIIHEAVLSELESQANKNQEKGYLGLEEIKRLRNLSKKFKYKVEYGGKKPDSGDIRRARTGGIDSLIRDLAFQSDATLITADSVQSIVAESKGIDVVLFKFESVDKEVGIAKYFDKKTMSVHLKENVTPFAKKGVPGSWKMKSVGKILNRDEVRDYAKEIIEIAGQRRDGFIEIERRGSTIVQLGDFRIVITKPPFADGWEITIVRPVTSMEFEDYKLDDKLKDRVAISAEGILIAGAPGHGKSTFAQGLAKFYVKGDKIVKTIEAPRDLSLPDEVTQYAISHGSSQEIHDVLLLSRPDYTIFDEMRNTSDFMLFADMRLSGVGMIGVMHATAPIDAIQRFIGRIELGVIPQIVDTVLFIKDGGVSKSFRLNLEVKVPSGMTEADLARPVVNVVDFLTGKLEYEIYTYGEQTVVVPVEREQLSPMKALAAQSVKRYFSQFADVDVDISSENKCTVYVPEDLVAKIIGKQGKRIDKIEKELGIRIDVKSNGDELIPNKEVGFTFKTTNKFVVFDLEAEGGDVHIYVKDEYLQTLHIGKKGIVKIKKSSDIGKRILKNVDLKGAIRMIV